MKKTKTAIVKPMRKGKNHIVPVRKRYIPLVCAAFLALLLSAGCDRFNPDFGGFVDEQLKHFRETDGTFIKWLYLTGGTFGEDTVYGSIAGTEISVPIFSEDMSGPFLAVFETGTGRELRVELSFNFAGQGKLTVSTSSKSKEYTVTLVPSPYRVRLDDRFYEKLSGAFASAGAGSKIFILQNIPIDSAEADSIKAYFSAGKQITLALEGDVPKIIKRDAGYTGSLFTVPQGASLTLEGGVGGSLVLDGGWIEGGGITATDALVTVDGGGKLTMNEGAVLRNNNNSGDGGGVYVGGISSIFSMEGGLITGNGARMGGGVYVDRGAFSMEGGLVNGNWAGKGGGVYVDGGTFGMDGGAVVNADNDVYLPDGKTITVTGNLTGAGPVATITVPDEKYDASTRVLDGTTELLSANYGKFGVTPQVGPVYWMVDSEGKLNSGSVVALRVTIGYRTLAGAVSAATLGTLATNPDVITILQNIDSSATMGNGDNGITIDGKHIKLVPASGSNKTIKRWSGNTGSLFTVSSGSLTLESAADGSLVIDGNNVAASDALINISGGTFTLGNGATLTNNNNRAVYVDGGTFTMTGGTISDNTAPEGGLGGGVNVDSGAFTMSGGTISDNTAPSDGGGGVNVDNSGTFTMSGGTISGNTTRWNGGGVLVNVNASFTMSGGTISGNDGSYGGGVCVRGIFLLQGGHIDGNTAKANYGWQGKAGGVFVAAGTFTMTGGTINNNILALGGEENAEKRGGGGVQVASGAAFNLYGGTISGNKSGVSGASVTKNGGGILSEGTLVIGDVSGGAFAGSSYNPLIGGSGNANSALNGGGVYIAGGTLTINKGTISYNTASGGNGGGVYVTGSGSSFTMSGTAAISNNTASGDGGGVYVADGNFTMSGTAAISGNAVPAATAHSGGGVYITGSGSSFTMNAGTISGNKALHADGDGGGVYVGNVGSFTMNDGIISGNQAGNNGGGCCVSDSGSNFTMNGGTISNNTAQYGGGAASVLIASFTMNGGTISGNTGTNGGGGGYLFGNGNFTMKGGIICGNTAAGNGGGGVFLYDNNTFKMQAGEISGNNCTSNNRHQIGNSGSPTIIWPAGTHGSVYLNGIAAGLSDEADGLVYIDSYAWYPVSTGLQTAATVIKAQDTSFMATGGTASFITVGGITYEVHTFTTVGTSSLVFSGSSVTADVLVVGGGGGGGRAPSGGAGGGGGGAGGLLSQTTTLSAATYSVVVGGGGTGGATSSTTGATGAVSSFDAISANGGGGGGGGNSAGNGTSGANGASGGGGGYGSAVNGSGGIGDVGGNNGAAGAATGKGGGGGGAGGEGQQGTTDNSGGAGGAGLAQTISGTSVTYASGGNGGYNTSGPGVGAGAANSGNGGQGGNTPGSAGFTGGSGIVIVRFPYTAP